MKKETLVNHLAELPALYQERQGYLDCCREDWLVGEEIAEYQRLEQLESDIDQQVDEAGRTIPYQLPEYHKEYKDILARLAELEPYIKQVKEIESALRDLHFTDFPPVQRVRALFWNKSVQEVQYQELSEAKERRERQNSKVMKLRLVAHKAHEYEVYKVKAQTRERLEVHQADSLNRKQELGKLALSRRLAKLQPVNARIRELLATAIQLDDK